MLFATEFSRYIASWGNSPSSSNFSVGVTEGILDFIDFKTEWGAELEARRRSSEPAGAVGPMIRPRMNQTAGSTALHPEVETVSGELYRNGHYREGALNAYIRVIEAAPRLKNRPTLRDAERAVNDALNTTSSRHFKISTFGLEFMHYLGQWPDSDDKQ
jgi:hypothetical protein